MEKDKLIKDFSVDSTRKNHRDWTGWALVSPMMVLLIIMTVGPTLFLLNSAFRRVNLTTIGQPWVGLDNFLYFFNDSSQMVAMVRTIAFALVVVFIELVLGMLIALPLQKQSRSNNIRTTLLIMPFAVAPIVSGLVFKHLLNPSVGWVNYFMTNLGFQENIEWLSKTPTSWIALIGVDIWQWTPFVSLILIAGLQSLPLEPREAAAIDGASNLQTFRFVTLPQLAPFVAIAVTLRLIQAFKTFDSFSILTNGGPGSSTENINLQLYRTALGSFQISSASAVAIIFLLILSLMIPILISQIGRNSIVEHVR
jgi:multiple sugar transport system permease protein